MTNPARRLKRAKIVTKDLGPFLPEPEVFSRWIAEIRGYSNRWASRCGDWIEFQAFSGLRPDTETPFVTWKHVDFDKNELVVTGSIEKEGFATRCLESEVDPATAAKWLEPTDGSSWVLKVYNPVRDAHSHAAAKEVSFR